MLLKSSVNVIQICSYLVGVKKILITGGAGLIGSVLSEMLEQKGCEVAHLSRTKKKNARFKTYQWDLEKNFIEEEALNNVSFIIHLAGEGIAAKRWTDSQKKEILNSRVKGPKLLFQKIKEKNIQLEGFFSASGINYYGSKTTETIFTEEDSPAQEFISDVVVEWEKAAFQFSEFCRVAAFRFGLVLDPIHGGLAKMIKPVKYYIGSPLGTGKQWMPWIHAHDAASCFLFAIENNSCTGVYNAIASEHVNNRTFVKTLGKVLHRPVFFPRVPAFLLRWMFGELSVLVLEGSRASNKKLIDAGFVFRYEKLEEALVLSPAFYKGKRE